FMLGGRYPTADQLSGVFRSLVELSAEKPASTSDIQSRVPSVAKTKTRVSLSVLKEAGIAQERRAGKWSARKDGVTEEQLAELAEQWRERSERDHEKLERTEAYARSARCRWRLLHEYFQEEMTDERCGACDNCRKGLDQAAQRPIAAIEAETSPQNEASDAGPELSVGDQVSLPKYGAGRVSEIEEDALVVRFPDGQQRKFKRTFARPVPRSRQKM
ncbi:MAG TPA: RecQ family zinc-binding domain-containing protein, partial [Gemmatimonadales bacterium]|nr:RecQ family zinc-binding domain-containing protein [Gemmatimonadales bacterium]